MRAYFTKMRAVSPASLPGYVVMVGGGEIAAVGGFADDLISGVTYLWFAVEIHFSQASVSELCGFLNNGLPLNRNTELATEVIKHPLI